MKLLLGRSERLTWGELTKLEKEIVFQSFNTGLLFALFLTLIVWVYCGTGGYI